MNHYNIYYDNKNGYYSNFVTVTEDQLLDTVNFIIAHLDGIITHIDRVVIE